MENKPLVTDEKGNEIYDLTYKSLVDAEFEYSGSYVIPDTYEMRPDLMSYILYGNSEKFDQFLKANMISNPFSFQAGDLVFVPDSFTIESHFVSLGSEEIDTKEAIRSQYIDPTKQPDSSSTARDIEKYKNREKLGLPPNILEDGEKEIIVSNGKIVYGPHVSVTKGEDSLEKEKYLKKLTNNGK